MEIKRRSATQWGLSLAIPWAEATRLPSMVALRPGGGAGGLGLEVFWSWAVDAWLLLSCGALPRRRYKGNNFWLAFALDKASPRWLPPIDVTTGCLWRLTETTEELEPARQG